MCVCAYAFCLSSLKMHLVTLQYDKNLYFCCMTNAIDITDRTALMELVSKDLSLTYDRVPSEDELIFMICQRVKELLDTDRDLLLSYLYRLDIPESKINAAMRITHQVPLEQSLGLLIFYRQLDRVRTKRRFSSGPPIEGWEF